MEDKAKNVLIGVLVVVAVVSLFFSIKGATTGQAIAEPDGILEINPGVIGDVNVSINDKFYQNIPQGERPYMTLDPGVYKITVKDNAKTEEDYVETINIESGKTTTVRPWTGQKAIIG